MGRQMNYMSTPDVPGRDIEEGLGVGTGSLVQSKHVAKVIRPDKNGQTTRTVRGANAILDLIEHTAKEMVSSA